MRSTGDLSAEERQAYALGRTCFEQGDDAQALSWLTRLVVTRPGFADVHYMLGLLDERRGNLEGAVRSLEQALRINPGYVEARLALVTLCERLGDFERAREVATPPAARRAGEEADGLDQTTGGKLANLQAALGDAYRDVGRQREAVEAYRKALDLCPEFHDIRQRLGIALREVGLPAQALAEFRRILRASPGFHAAAIQAGLTCYTLGRTDEALAAWRGVLEREPGREDAQRYIRMVEGSRRPAPGPAGDPAP